jgi:hypothetical protein
MVRAGACCSSATARLPRGKVLELGHISQWIADALLRPTRGRIVISAGPAPQDILGPTQCRHGPREADGRQRKQNRVPDLLR